MRIVTPFRPFPPESKEHLELGEFDWLDAIRMLRASAANTCVCETVAITDVDTELPGPTFKYETTRRRLMLWILEVSLRYLESPDFDQDTVMVSPDILVLGNLRPFFRADLTVIVRPAEKFVAAERPLLNSAQWWRVEAKERLVAFYRDALLIADRLSEDLIIWGGDTVPLLQLLSPLDFGIVQRAGLAVSMVDQRDVMATFSSGLLKRMEEGRPYYGLPLMDFKYLRKRHMREFFNFAMAGLPV